MLSEWSINSWTLHINSFLDHKNLLAFASKLNSNTTINEFSIKGFIKKEDDAFLGCAILFWSVSYLIYEKWLHLLLRHKCFPLIQRNRIISTIWDCIFSIIAAKYLLCIFSLSSAKSMLPKLTKLSLLLYKSFYIHHGGVDIFIHGLWMKGCSDLLFAFFAFNRHWERSDSSIVLLLFLKIIDAIILDVCRLLLCFWNKRINKNCSKLLFLVHCLTWTYIYILFVPENVLWGSNSKNLSENFYMWMWYIFECLNSVWLRIFCRLEMHLFPPPSQGAIEFVKRLQKQKTSSQRKPSGQNAKKAELLKTLSCVMSLKKKLQRIRKAREDKMNLQFALEEEKHEVVSEKDTKQKEIMQTLICAMKVRKEIQKIRKEKRNNPDSETVTAIENTEN